MNGPGLFEAAAELIAIASGKPLSQVHAELAPAPMIGKCHACRCTPCACPQLFRTCEHCGGHLLLEHGGRGVYSCPKCYRAVQ